MITRLGNKKNILKYLLPLFPQKKIHTFIDLFFGSGSVAFAMQPQCKYVIANDLDNEIFNLYSVIRNHKDDFIKAWELTPVTQELFKFWKNNNESNHIQKAVRFVYMSFFGLMGKNHTFKIDSNNQKKLTFEKVENFYNKICNQNFQFANVDFRHILEKYHCKENKINDTFIYADPPYLHTCQSQYKTSQKWTKSDTFDLITLCKNSVIDFAISEFDTPAVVDMAKSAGLLVHRVCTRQNLKNVRNEILITNYEI